MADAPPKIRYDQWTEFHNPTTQDFVGKWDGEEYLIAKGTGQVFPVWLARHFAKRLCDEEMIKRYKVPLKPDAPERLEFIQKCLTVDLSDIDTSPDKRKVSMKEQIESDRAAQQQAEAEAEDQGTIEQGAILQPSTGTTGEVPIGDDELPNEAGPLTGEPPAEEEPPKTEEELVQEVAQENLDAVQGKAKLSKNNPGSQDGGVEFEGNVENIQPVQPPGYSVE